MFIQGFKQVIKVALGITAFMGLLFGGAALVANAQGSDLFGSAASSVQAMFNNQLLGNSQTGSDVQVGTSENSQPTGKEQDAIEVKGTVDAITDTSITVDGVEYTLTDKSELPGDVKVGDSVELKLTTDESGNVVVREVELTGEDDQGEDNNGEDINDDDQAEVEDSEPAEVEDDDSTDTIDDNNQTEIHDGDNHDDQDTVEEHDGGGETDTSHDGEGGGGEDSSGHGVVINYYYD